MGLPRKGASQCLSRRCVTEMMKLKIRLETEEWVYEEHEMA